MLGDECCGQAGVIPLSDSEMLSTVTPRPASIPNRIGTGGSGRLQEAPCRLLQGQALSISSCAWKFLTLGCPALLKGPC